MVGDMLLSNQYIDSIMKIVRQESPMTEEHFSSAVFLFVVSEVG